MTNILSLESISTENDVWLKKKIIWLFLIPVIYCYDRVSHHRDLDIIQTNWMSAGSAETHTSANQLNVVTKYLNFLDTRYWNWSRHVYFKVVLFKHIYIIHTLRASQQSHIFNEKGVILEDGWRSWKKYVGNNTIYYGKGERTEKKDK